MNTLEMTAASPQRLEILGEQRQALHKLRLAITKKKARSIVLKCHAQLMRLENALCVPGLEEAGR